MDNETNLENILKETEREKEAEWDLAWVELEQELLAEGLISLEK